MGIYITAAIVVGLQEKEFERKTMCDAEGDEISDGFINPDGKYISFEDVELDLFEAVWDSSDQEKVVYGLGYQSTEPRSVDELDIDLEEIEKLKKEFLDITGMSGKVLLMPSMI